VRDLARFIASPRSPHGPSCLDPCLTVVGLDAGLAGTGTGGRDFVYADSSKSARVK